MWTTQIVPMFLTFAAAIGIASGERHPYTIHGTTKTVTNVVAGHTKIETQTYSDTTIFPRPGSSISAH